MSDTAFLHSLWRGIQPDQTHVSGYVLGEPHQLDPTITFQCYGERVLQTPKPASDDLTVASTTSTPTYYGTLLVVTPREDDYRYVIYRGNRAAAVYPMARGAQAPKGPWGLGRPTIEKITENKATISGWMLVSLPRGRTELGKEFTAAVSAAQRDIDNTIAAVIEKRPLKCSEVLLRLADAVAKKLDTSVKVDLQEWATRLADDVASDSD